MATYKKIQIPIGDEDVRMFEDLISGDKKPFTWTFDKIDVEFIADDTESSEEWQEPKPVDKSTLLSNVTPDEQSALNRIADSYLYANFPKSANGIYAHAEVIDLASLWEISEVIENYDEGDGEVEIYIVKISYGQQDDCHNDTYHDTIAVRLDELKRWIEGQDQSFPGGWPPYIVNVLDIYK